MALDFFFMYFGAIGITIFAGLIAIFFWSPFIDIIDAQDQDYSFWRNMIDCLKDGFGFEVEEAHR